MNNFKELKVWQKSMTLVKEIYSATKDFPKEEKLASQARFNDLLFLFLQT